MALRVTIHRIFGSNQLLLRENTPSITAWGMPVCSCPRPADEGNEQRHGKKRSMGIPENGVEATLT